MKYRIVRLIWLTIVLGLIAPPLVAERNMIPGLANSPDVYSERPNEPDWMEHIALQDAYQRVLVQDIYQTQSMRRVVKTASCDCAMRSQLGIQPKPPSEKTMPERTVQKCFKPRTPTIAVQMNFDLKPKRSAKQLEIGRDILK